MQPKFTPTSKQQALGGSKAGVGRALLGATQGAGGSAPGIGPLGPQPPRSAVSQRERGRREETGGYRRG